MLSSHHCVIIITRPIWQEFGLCCSAAGTARQCTAVGTPRMRGARGDRGGSGGGRGGLRTFVGSFNINGQDLSVDAARGWLEPLLRPAPVAGGGDGGGRRRKRCLVDLVALGLQECPSCPLQVEDTAAGAEVVDLTALALTEQGQGAAQELARCGPGEDMVREIAERNERLLRVLLDTLNGTASGNGTRGVDGDQEKDGEEEMVLIADVAMGEPATGKKIMVPDVVKDPSAEELFPVEWFGYIRLLVFAKASVARMCGTPELFQCPAGRKLSIADPHQPYRGGLSPDKGCVAVRIPEHDLLFVNGHLAGTNKHGVSELQFSTARLRQLSTLQRGLSTWFHGTLPSRIILLGDLNFRVEMLPDAKSKERGGADFCAVKSIVESGDDNALRRLFYLNDKLHLFLRLAHGDLVYGAEEDASALSDEPEAGALLASLVDTLAERMATPDNDSDSRYMDPASRNPNPPHPTFTFPPDAPPPRTYFDKRTPSWTDRILWTGAFFFRENQRPVFNVCKHVIISDHEPVWALFDDVAGHSAGDTPEDLVTRRNMSSNQWPWWWYWLAAVTAAAGVAALSVTAWYISRPGEQRQLPQQQQQQQRQASGVRRDSLR